VIRRVLAHHAETDRQLGCGDDRGAAPSVPAGPGSAEATGSGVAARK